MSATLLSSEMLDELQRLLLERGARVAQAWRPQQRTREQIAERMAEIGLSLPDELAIWWAWHDGVEGDNFMYRLVHGWEPFSVDDAVDETQQMRQIYGDMELPPITWEPSWVEIAFDGSRGHLVCDTAVPAGAPSPISCGFSDGWDAPVPALPSLGELVTLWINALRDGIVHIDERGAFEHLPPEQRERLWGDLADLI